jgi:hypothetical protein
MFERNTEGVTYIHLPLYRRKKGEETRMKLGRVTAGDWFGCPYETAVETVLR